jgi:ABC-type sugar transport system substrate-binding protein
MCLHWILLLVVAGMVGCDRTASEKGGTQGRDSGDRGVMLLRYAHGSESTEQRERGFMDTMQKEFPEIRIISEEGYAGATRQTALDASQRLLDKYGDRLDGIFACNESSANGMLKALEQAGLDGKVVFVGFDTSTPMITAMEEGKMQGLVLQDPVRMAYLAVKTMVDHLDGKTVEKSISTGELVASPENMNDPEVKERLSPPKFSGEEANPENPKYRIGVVPKGTTHDFWQSVHFGAEKAAAELGNVKIIWQGPLNEDQKDDQRTVVENLVTSKVDGICLAPVDSQALVGAVKHAREENVPVVIFDSGLADESIIVSYVATDNYNGGVLAARRLGEVLRQKQK